ncbi:MAG: DEAD/DEAH box helicase [Candidatus Heimdallarchaeaceae archaeon]
MSELIKELRDSFESSLQKIDSLIEQLKIEREKIKTEFQKRIESLQLNQYDLNQLNEFFEEPYVILPTRKPHQWYVIVPKWINFQVGWLERQTKGYNIFLVNKYVKWFTEIPKVLEQRFQFKESLPLKVYDGMLLTGKELQEVAWQRYRKFLTRKHGVDRIRIKKGYEFKLIAQMIEDGTLPFLFQPIDSSDLREWNKIELRSYQKQAWKTFLKTGALGIFWAFGSGKSLFGIYALARIKGKKLVIVPSLTLKEQWIKRIEEYIPQFKHEIEIQTYHAYHKVRDKNYVLIEFDECQHLPANTFIKLSTLKTKYRLGFSGSPYREDGRENYIIALTGFPIGISWEDLIKLQVIKEPKFRVYILKDNREKLRKLEDLLNIPLKTIIFCDWIDFGKKIASKFNIPFIYGQTKDRLEVIKNAQICVVSRVGDEGISIPDIERVIEISFLFGSRMQESQRFGRLMHSLKQEPEHIILMNEKEFEKYQKRLYAITERGFRIEFIR